MDYFFIGDPELVTAFRFVGVGGIPAFDAEEAREAFLRITRGWDGTAGLVLPGAVNGAEGCRVLIITEEVADWLGDLLVKWQLSDRYPLVVEIPGVLGRNPGRKTLVDSIREAIGIHV
ncbi:MAG: ATPase V [Treponema sp.]|jgi:V/A-type H+-transporting ATPase subunit F|nr:ATPase V [Treponema sp.]